MSSTQEMLSVKRDKPPHEGTGLLAKQKQQESADESGDECFSSPNYGNEFAASMSLAVACIGAGVLALPSGFAQAGLAFAAITVVLIGYLTVLTLRYLIEVREAMGLDSYDDMSQELLGPWAEHLSRWVVICYNVGANIGYIIVMGNILEPFRADLARLTGIEAFATDPLLPQQVYWLLVMLPLSCVRDMKKLNSSTTLAIAASIFVAVMVVARYFFPVDEVNTPAVTEAPASGSDHHAAAHHHHVSAHTADVTFRNGPVGEIVFANLSVNAMVAVAILMFAMDCQTMIFQTYNSLKKPSMAAITRVSVGSVSVASFVYAAVGLFGYLSWRDAVNDNILLNYNPKKDWLASIAYVVYAIPVTMAYALYLFPTKDMFFSHMLGTRLGEYVPSKYFYPVSFLFSFITVVLALYFPSIAVLSALLGGLFSSLLCFIFPAAFVLKMHYKKIKVVESSFGLAQRWFVLCFGFFACVLGTYASMMQVFHPHQPATS